MGRFLAAVAFALASSLSSLACSNSDASKDGGSAGKSSHDAGSAGDRASGGDTGSGGDRGSGADAGGDTGGDTSATGNEGGNAPGEGGTGSSEIGAVPEELVGIWQETRASGGDYTNNYGEDFSATSGFSVQLRISEDGSYRWSHYAAGVAPNCAHVSYFDR